MSKMHKRADGTLDDHYYSHKTSYKHDWSRGFYIERILTRSFETLEAANKFAVGKNVRDIYRKKGKFVVEWLKVIDNN